MTQDSQHEPIEQIFVNILKDYAYYLKETAKRHDEDIRRVDRESIANKACLDEKINDDRIRLTKLEIQIKNQQDNADIRSKTGWTVAEKIAAVLAFMITIGVAIANIIFQ